MPFKNVKNEFFNFEKKRKIRTVFSNYGHELYPDLGPSSLNSQYSSFFGQNYLSSKNIGPRTPMATAAYAIGLAYTIEWPDIFIVSEKVSGEIFCQASK